MGPRMSSEVPLQCESFIALVALEESLPSVRLHVPLQITSCKASVVALVTFERLFSCVLPHHVNFQLRSCNARKIARCAPVGLFTRVRLLVGLQLTCLSCFEFTLIAMMQLFPSVLLDMPFEVGRIVARIVALIAMIQFFPVVLLDMYSEVGSPVA